MNPRVLNYPGPFKSRGIYFPQKLYSPPHFFSKIIFFPLVLNRKMWGKYIFFYRFCLDSSPYPYHLFSLFFISIPHPFFPYFFISIVSYFFSKVLKMMGANGKYISLFKSARVFLVDVKYFTWVSKLLIKYLSTIT